MKPDETLAHASRVAAELRRVASVHPDPNARAFELSVDLVKARGPRFVRLIDTLFAPPPIGELVPKPQAQTTRELHELVQSGVALVAAVLVALEELAPLPPLPKPSTDGFSPIERERDPARRAPKPEAK